MEQRNILVVDDEQDLCDILLFNLSAQGYQATAAYSAEEALQMIQRSETGACCYDLLLLDVMMPGMSGYDLARRLKNDPFTARTPIIFLTAKDAEDDTLTGFGIGADDYITKPFSIREVMARIRAVLNRSTHDAAQSPAVVAYKGLALDITGKRVSVDGEETALTKTEFELLSLLLSHPSAVFSRKQLLDEVWPADVVVTDRTVDVNIARLRKKLGPYASCIVARQGFGYCFQPQE